MKQHPIYYLLAICSVLKIVSSTFSVSEIEEIALTCNMDGCTECASNSCSRCQLGFFLYQIPQTFDPDQGYTLETYICVKCPLYEDATFSYIPCGDCVDNPNDWAKKRQCTYQYTIDANSPGDRQPTDVIMKQMYSQLSLYYVSAVSNNGVYTSSTSLCDGCQSFCGNNVLETGCNSFTSNISPDTLQDAVICLPGYYWNKGACTLCTLDKSCRKCKRDTDRSIICVVCTDGYALNNSGACEKCTDKITNCQKCYYGDDSGRNYSSDPTNFVGKPLPANTYLRCIYCADTQTNTAGGSTITNVKIDVMMIPSLDLKTCESCPSGCSRCDYSISTKGQEIHTKNPRVIPTADQGDYKKRCRICTSGKVLSPTGSCDNVNAACDTTKCKICVYGTLASSTPSEQFITLAVNNYAVSDTTILNSVGANTMYCALCKKGYNRDNTGACVSDSINLASQSCHSSISSKCVICNDGKVADISAGTCANVSQAQSMTSCGQYYKATSGGSSSTSCFSCVSYDGTETASGYPNYETNACTRCDNNGICSECTQQNWRFTMQDYIQLVNPYLSDNFQTVYKDTLQLESTPWCLSCTSPNIQDPWTGTCYGCSSSCNGCTRKFGYPQCYSCSNGNTLVSGLTVKQSQNNLRIGCHMCSDYERNCVELDTAEQSIKNPYYTSTSKFYGKVRWTKANQCRAITGDIGTTIPSYSSAHMFYNSYNQKCIVCQNSASCKKKVVIPYFIDNVNLAHVLINTYMTGISQTATFSGYYAYSLPYFSSQSIDININMREALEFDSLYMKLSEEGVEEIEFQIIFTGNAGAAGYLGDAKIDFNLSFKSQAFEMIPTLQELKATITTMTKGDYSSIGQKKMKLFIKDTISFSQFSSVSFNNVDIYPLQNTDGNAESNPFFIKLIDNKSNTKVSFTNCKIANTNTLDDQESTFADKGTSQYFSLVASSLVSLTLDNFEIYQIYYPPQINFFDPGHSDLKSTLTLTNTKFTQTYFSYVTVFGLNNTSSTINFSGVTVQQSYFYNAYFIKEKDGLSQSYIRLDMSDITFSDITMEDSSLVYVMNAVRFKASQWTFQGPFKASSINKVTALIVTNLLSIEGVTVQNNPNNNGDIFYLNKATLFSTPQYSLLIQQNQQINHRYTTVNIDEVKCDMASDQDTLDIYTCFFDLRAPYNPYHYLLNVKMQTVTIRNTKTTATELQSNWKIANLEDISALEMNSVNLFKNQMFQGFSVKSPDAFTISSFICGDDDDTIYNSMFGYSGTTALLDKSKLHGYCLYADFCSSKLSFEKITVQNYVGYIQPAINIECIENLASPSNQQGVPVTIDSFTVNKAIIFIDDPNIKAAPLLISNDYEYKISMTGISVQTSQLTAINGLLSTSFSSATVLLVDSISSSLEIYDSLIQNTISLFTENPLSVVVTKLIVQNTIFRNANQGKDSQPVTAEGGFINARASFMTFNDVTFETSVGNKGSALHLKTIDPGQINITGRTKFYDVKSTTNIQADGQGGAIYVDCTDSVLSMVIDGATFENVLARTVGGVLYVNSGSMSSDITIKNSLIKNVYAPQGSIIYAQQINSSSKIKLETNIVEWTDQKFIYNYITSTLDPGSNPPDPLLIQALQYHSQIWISKGILETKTNRFIGLMFQQLFLLTQLVSWEDTGSVILGYQMTSYPLISTFKIDTIKFTNSVFSDISPYSATTPGGLFNYFTTSQPSIISHYQDGDITYTGVKIENNRGLTEHGINYFQQWTGVLTIDTCQYNYNSGQYGALYMSQLSSSVSSSRMLVAVTPADTSAVIKGSTFTGNYATQGAAINSYSTTLDVSASTFTNNFSTGSGGAIYSVQPSSSTVTITFAGLTFTNNQAGSGGAYQIYGISPTLSTITQNTFTSNIATYYGATNAESPIYMRLVYNGNVYTYKKGDTVTPTIKAFGSGQNPGGMIIQLIGSDGKIVRQQTAKCTVSLNYVNETPDDTVKISGNPTISFDESIGGYNFTNTIFIAKPPNNMKIKFQSDAVIIPIKDNAGTVTSYDTSYVFPLIITMRECVYGEIYEATTGQCYACPARKYSLVLGAEACLSCPKLGVDECPGYNEMSISAGYWRKSTATDLIEECNNLPANCVGGNTNQLCYEGHIGALCEECDLYQTVWEDAWAPSGGYVCGKCSEISGNLQKVLIISIWTLITTLLSVKATIIQVQQYIQTNILVRAAFISPGKSSDSKNQSGVLLKILTSYFQVIAVIFTFKLTLPSFFQTTTSAVGNPSQQMSVSMDCFFLQMSDIHVAYFRLIWQIINPTIYIIAAVLAYFIGVILKKVRKNTGYIWCTCIFLFITLQPSVILAFISTASCRNIGGVNYIKSNVSLECYTSEHNYYLVVLIIPCLLIWAIIIPLLFFLKLHKSRDQIYKNIWIRYRYGYLYMEYAPRAYFWEFVKIFEKITLIIIINIYDNDTKVKGVLCFLTVVIYLILSYVYKPYREKEQNRLDQRANEACAISMIMGVFIYENSYDYLIYLGYLFLALINILFVLDIVRSVLRGYTTKLDDAIEKQHDKIIKILAKFPRLQKYLQKKHKAYVSVGRVTYLWKRTSKIVHQWFELRKTNPEFKFENLKGQIKEDVKFVLSEQVKQSGEFEKMVIQQSKKSKFQKQDEADQATQPPGYTPIGSNSPQLEVANLLQTQSVNIKKKSNYDSIEETEDFNLDDPNTQKNVLLGQNKFDDNNTPRRSKLNKADSIFSQQNKKKDINIDDKSD